MSERLNPKEKMFVQQVANGVDPKVALVEAGWNPTTEKSLSTAVHKVLHRDRVQNALAVAIEKRFPNVANDAAGMLIKLMKKKSARDNDRLKAIQLLATIFGWAAPSKSVSFAVKQDIKLPEE